MNLNNIVSHPVAVDLSGTANEFAALKLTSTGIALAGAQDFVIGHLVRGNAAPSNGQTIPTTFKPACDLSLRGGALINFVLLGATTAAINQGDELVIDPANPGQYINKPVVALTGVASTGVFTATGGAHGLAIGDPIRLTGITGATAGLTAGAIYWVLTVPSSTTFTVSTSQGGAGVTWTTDVSAGSFQTIGNAFGDIVIAWDSAPTGAANGGQIRAVAF